MAIGYIHMGTMAGKLNGVMPATTPERLAHRVGVDLGRDVLGEVALEEMGDAAGELDDLETALHLAAGVGEDLAVLGREQLGDVLAILLDELPEGEQDAGARRDRCVPPPGKAALADATAGVDVGGRGKRDPPATRPVAGLYTSPQRSGTLSSGLSLIQWRISFIVAISCV